ncbi:uncharacterized protein B0H64DRAFT_145159 [Chaetomium fimeti]|uniref:Uncharacterized protein n=1 Tax=Chaetomium fimeti TaxID=1854472 RepID=A0AAE0HF28_9PEZI|nr:hypothetical protein B0H64DRAFT_145159 [Chaetomium fimeti]
MGDCLLKSECSGQNGKRLGCRRVAWPPIYPNCKTMLILTPIPGQHRPSPGARRPHRRPSVRSILHRESARLVAARCARHRMAVLFPAASTLVPGIPRRGCIVSHWWFSLPCCKSKHEFCIFIQAVCESADSGTKPEGTCRSLPQCSRHSIFRGRTMGKFPKPIMWRRRVWKFRD